MKQQTTYIYCLTDPETSAIRYVGKSIDPAKRLRGHINAAKYEQYDHHTSRWIRKLLATGLEPQMQILETVASDRDWRDVERQWIAMLEQSGADLTNSTAGGEGLDYRDPEEKARFIAKVKASLAAYRSTPEGQDQLKRMMAKSHTPETRAKRAESLRESYKNPELKAKILSTLAEINSRPEVKRKRAEASRAMWQDPEQRRKLEEKFATPEVKRKQSESKKRAWADPELGKNLRAAAQDPERRAKIAASAVERATSEYREMMRQRTESMWADPEKRKAVTAGMQALVADKERNAARVEKMRQKSVAAWSDPEAKARRLEKMRDPEVVAKKKAALRAKWADPEWRAQREANAARRKAERLATQPQPPL